MFKNYLAIGLFLAAASLYGQTSSTQQQDLQRQQQVLEQSIKDQQTVLQRLKDSQPSGTFPGNAVTSTSSSEGKNKS